MRVAIDHGTIRKGLLFRTAYYEVSCTVHFSHEELHVLRARNLLSTKLMDRRPATARVDDRDAKFELRLNDLVNGKTDRFLCATPSDAKIYAEELVAALEQVKRWIGDNTEIGRRHVVEF